MDISSSDGRICLGIKGCIHALEKGGVVEDMDVYGEGEPVPQITSVAWTSCGAYVLVGQADGDMKVIFLVFN